MVSALAFGCQKADDAANANADQDQATGKLMSELLDIVNPRETPCSEAGKRLGAYASQSAATVTAATRAYADAKAAGKETLKPVARPIQNSRPAVNRFRRRCPAEMASLAAILDQVTGGDIKFTRQVAGTLKDEGDGDDHAGHGHAAGEHGSGAGGGGGGGGSAGTKATATIPAVDRPTQTLSDAAGTEVGPPKAEDLAGYIADLKGKGPLMARIETTMGKFECELFEKQTPMTVANFVGLARGKKAWIHPGQQKAVKGDYFTGIVFHRVIPDFMLQTGDPAGNGTGGPGYNFADEFVPTLKHDKPGIMSMANRGPTTNGSQFFITEKATPWLDNRHTVFGQCDNHELIKTIARVEKDPANKSAPARPIYITKVTIYRK